MKNEPIAILMGSDSDLPLLKGLFETLNKYSISYSTHIMSAHRTPETVAKFASSAKKKKIKVIIAAAGGAAHLAGVIAAHTTLPVIGIPIPSSDLKGLDALLSTVQMPAGIPVATVAIGKAGAVNAALLAIQILAITNKKYSAIMDKHKLEMVKKVKAKNAKLKSISVNNL